MVTRCSRSSILSGRSLYLPRVDEIDETRALFRNSISSVQFCYIAVSCGNLIKKNFWRVRLTLKVCRDSYLKLLKGNVFKAECAHCVVATLKNLFNILVSAFYFIFIST